MFLPFVYKHLKKTALDWGIVPSRHRLQDEIGSGPQSVKVEQRCCLFGYDDKLVVCTHTLSMRWRSEAACKSI